MEAIKCKYNKNIIINYFDEILISFIKKGSDFKCCRQCILNRFINTRKDRIYIKKDGNFSLDQNSLFRPMIDSILSDLRKDDKLVDKYGRRKVVIVNKNTLEIKSVYCNAIPDCNMCSTLENNSYKEVNDFGSFLLNEINSNEHKLFRSNKPRYWDKLLEKLILNKDLGIVTTLLDYFEYAFPNAVAILPLSNGVDEPGTGRTSNLYDSRGIALLEAMERYAGFTPKGQKTYIFDTFNNLKKDKKIINVKNLILNEDSVGINTSKKFAFDKNKKYHWVYGYNLTKKTPQLVPETMVYYGMTLKDQKYRNEIISYEISNGCSIGGSLMEASYFGALEIIERDAFLTSWYLPHDINKINLNTITNDSLKNDIKIFFNNYSEFDLNFYDISNDTKIPVILATIERKNIQKDRMNFMCAASADFDVQEAMIKSLHEITSIFYGLQSKFKEQLSQVKAKAENLDLVNSMEDHSLVYGYYKNLNKIPYKKMVNKVVNIDDYLIENNDNSSLNHNYKLILNHLKEINKNIIIIDQTSEEMKKIGLFCTKTLIPGLLPMTFGYKNIRLSKKRIKEMEEFFGNCINKINLSPHPFP